MGIVSLPLLDLKTIIQGNEEKSKLSESLWNKVLGAQAKRRSSSSWQVIRKRRVTWKNGHIKIKKPRRILMKKRARLEDSRRSANVIERKVKTLKKLIPKSESMDLDELFRETADYILDLQMKLKVIQIMVNVLTGSEEWKK